MPSPVAVLPLCPVACGSILTRIGGELRAVVIVKATFALAHERSAWPTSPLPLVEEDVAVDATGRLSSACDLVPPLPGAGVTVVGTARAPGGRPTPEMAVRLAIFQGGRAMINKPLRVVGDRTHSAATPLPFVEMPVSYERAAGGPGVAENPSGVGVEASGRRPNVIDPMDPTRPAGFGPIAPSWAPRAEAFARGVITKGGEELVVSRNVDLRCFHAAPRDQHLVHALRGDEWLVLDGFHPNLLRIQSQLPYARAEARVARTDRPGVLEPLELVADMLTIDADAQLASVVWRGYRALSSAAEATVLRVFVGLALPTIPIRWPTPVKAEPVAEPSADASEEAEWPEVPDTTSERDVRAIQAMLASQPLGGAMAREGARQPATLDLDATAEVSGQSIQPALPFSRTSPSIVAPVSGARTQPRQPSGTTDLDQSKLRASLLPFLASKPSSPQDAAERDGSATSRSPSVPGAAFKSSPNVLDPQIVLPPDARGDLRGMIEARRRVGASLVGLKFARAELGAIDLSSADLRGIDLTEVRLAGANLQQARLQGAMLVGADLRGTNLVGADLSKADLSRATLSDAVLDGANLADARLISTRGEATRATGVRAPRARFSRASWDRADLRGAELDGADFTGASLAGARFTDARLQEAVFADAHASGAIFDGARLTRATLNAATFTEASFDAAEASHAVWDDARLERASFVGARLERARFARTIATSATFAGADLRYAALPRMDAASVDLHGADLRGAELRQARLRGALAEEANLRGIQAALADLTEAKLARADLTGANLREANLTRADLSAAKLDDADLREANLTGATATGASQNGTKTAGALSDGAIGVQSPASKRSPPA